MSKTTDAAAGVVRTCEILKVLKGHTLTGLTLTDIARTIGATPSTTLRTLQGMATRDAVIQLDSGRWALGIALLQVAESHHREMSKASGRISELTQRVAAGAYTS